MSLELGEINLFLIQSFLKLSQRTATLMTSVMNMDTADSGDKIR